MSRDPDRWGWPTHRGQQSVLGMIAALAWLLLWSLVEPAVGLVRCVRRGGRRG